MQEYFLKLSARVSLFLVILLVCVVVWLMLGFFVIFMIGRSYFGFIFLDAGLPSVGLVCQYQYICFISLWVLVSGIERHLLLERIVSSCAPSVIKGVCYVRVFGCIFIKWCFNINDVLYMCCF